MPVTVKWGKERITFDLPSPDTKLSTIRKSLAEYTHLPLNAFKLIHAGATMRDDNLPISAYHLRPNSVIVLIGSDYPSPTVPLPVPASSSSTSTSPSSPSPSPHNNNNNDDATPRMDPKSVSQQSTISQIHSELTKVRAELAPGVELYLTNAGASGSSGPVPHHGRHGHQHHNQNAHPQQQQHQQQHQQHQQQQHHEKEKEKEKERTRLSELLLQSLLRLDGIAAPSSGPGESRDDIRRERKEAVKEVQGLLDRLDGGASQA